MENKKIVDSDSDSDSSSDSSSDYSESNTISITVTNIIQDRFEPIIKYLTKEEREEYGFSKGDQIISGTFIKLESGLGVKIALTSSVGCVIKNFVN